MVTMQMFGRLVVTRAQGMRTRHSAPQTHLLTLGSSDQIHQHAQTLLTSLALERKSEETVENPILWVCHSLGGILVKRALELSADLQSKNADDLRSIFVSTYGIMFLGTPHIGADPAKWGLVLQGMVNALVPRKFLDTQSGLIQTLQTNSETLQNINLKFLDIYQRFKVCLTFWVMAFAN